MVRRARHVLNSDLLLLSTGGDFARLHAVGYRSGAADFAPVDAAALGDTLPTSVGLFAASDSYVGAGGMGVRGGALRGYVGWLPAYRGVRWLVGAGFARTLAARAIVGRVQGTLGVELAGGYRHMEYAPRDAAALRLTAPLGLAHGNPSAPSLGFYAARYAESGVMRRWVRGADPCAVFCSSTLCSAGLESALGVGAGLRASFGRLSLELSLRDVVSRGPQFYEGSDAAIGFTYRFGR